MIWAWLVEKLGGIGARLAVFGMVLAIVAFGFWRGMAAIDAAQERAVKAAVSAERGYWVTEIANSNALAERERLEMSRRILAAETERAEAETQAKTAFDELEKKNAELPDGDGCGLSLERGSLLDTIR